ncbi:hypothetical protein LIER_04086 [Lithospermum erythrorhizon]|uniref:Reverse transcriptase zinc-binding domain-containing protein n=1 Tax=Lithospermum erythrorhizon TaxID=34254 RepID=A0AAV3NY98_LITER
MLWIKWVDSVRLRHESVWAYKKRDHDPCDWKKLLMVRPILYEFFRVEPGNGRDVFFWNDPWILVGSAWNWLTPNERSYLQIEANAKLSEVVSISMSRLRSQSSLWEKIRPRAAKVEWASEPECFFCDQHENRNHLFFECRFSGQIWKLMLQKMGCYTYVKSWEEEAIWCMQSLKGKRFRQRVKQLVFTTVVYDIWQQTNRCHGENLRPAEVVYHQVVAIIQGRVDTWRNVPKSKENWQFCLGWGFNHRILRS